ncbi:MAG TPA: hypothetical protein VFK13_09190 [Gemmatimonadaceae bacterium]|nr:hypothetical protein [Gemmatimonadaceae bacterium]
MVTFFPRHSIEWHLLEPSQLRRVSLSLPAMAIITGLVARVYRMFVLGQVAIASWWILFGTVVLGALIVLTLVTLHLANYPLRNWLWRAPVFGAVAGASEAAVSALLIALGVERAGTQLAHWHDWVPLVQSALVREVVSVVLFAALLAGVVQLVRTVLLQREHRTSTAEAVHRGAGH